MPNTPNFPPIVPIFPEIIEQSDVERLAFFVLTNMPAVGATRLMVEIFGADETKLTKSAVVPLGPHRDCQRLAQLLFKVYTNRDIRWPSETGFASQDSRHQLSIWISELHFGIEGKGGFTFGDLQAQREYALSLVAFYGYELLRTDRLDDCNGCGDAFLLDSPRRRYYCRKACQQAEAARRYRSRRKGKSSAK